MLRNLTFLALLLTSGAALAEAPHWGYGRQHGPGEWAHLDPAFATCAEGTLQSPIDIRTTRKAPLPKLEFLYRATPLQLVNNGHTVQVNAPPGSILTVDGKVHELLQLHFHTPSEEAIRGRRFPLVAHLVHRGTDGTLAVVAVLFDAGKPSRGLAQFFGRLPGEPGETRSFQRASVNPASLLPRKLGYYAFEGSLTTPPCTEGVQWYVLKEPVKLSRKQLAAFRKLFKENARPVQPLNGRVVRESA